MARDFVSTVARPNTTISIIQQQDLTDVTNGHTDNNNFFRKLHNKNGFQENKITQDSTKMGRKGTIKAKPRTPTQMLNFHPVIHRGPPQDDAVANFDSGCRSGNLISNRNSESDSNGLGGNFNSNFESGRQGGDLKSSSNTMADWLGLGGNLNSNFGAKFEYGCRGGDLISNIGTNIESELNFLAHQNNNIKGNNITVLNDQKNDENVSQINQVNQKNGWGGKWNSSSNNKNSKNNNNYCGQGGERNSHGGNDAVVDNTDDSPAVTQATVPIDEQYWMLPGAVFTGSG